MLQQIFAIIIIFFFIFRLLVQKRKNEISINEFILWIIFWIISGLLIIFIKKIDSFVAELGFSGSGIEILFYLAVVIIFYVIFKLRLKLEKMERDITKIVRYIAKNKLQ